MQEEAYLNEARRRCELLDATRLWERGDAGVRPIPWLSNFEEHERIVAAALLEVLVFFSENQTTELLRRSLVRLLSAETNNGGPPAERRNRCADFVGNAIFVPVEGEHPTPADSGNFLCRATRQLLRLEDRHISSPRDAILAYGSGKHLVFVDDFVGSGQQLIHTWRRNYREQSPRSFAEAYAQNGTPSYYACLVAHGEGLSNIAAQIPKLSAYPAHEIGERDSFRTSLSRLRTHPRTSTLSVEVESLLRKYAPRLELPSYMRQREYPVLGFRELGLTIAFKHSVPDGTLPIIWASGGDSWVPLVRRS